MRTVLGAVAMVAALWSGATAAAEHEAATTETAAVGSPSAHESAAQAEAEFVAHLNEARVATGLPPLAVDPGLTAAAREWTTWMADRGTLRHADDIATGAPDDWTKVGENVGRGASVLPVWEAFMDSPSHAANVLDPRYSLVGVAVVRSDDGVLYTTHRFAGTGGPVPTPGPASPTVGAPPEDLAFVATETGGGPDAALLAATLGLLLDATT